MIERRRFIEVIAGGLLAAPLAAEAQEYKAGKGARVGVLDFGRVPSPEEIAKEPFSKAMREVGWVEGQNIVIERRYGESADQLHASAVELVRLKVDVLVVPSCGLAKIVQGETRTLPIVVPVEKPEEFEKAFADIVRQRAGAIFVFADALTFGHRQQLVDFARGRRLPMSGYMREFAEAGCLLSYGPNLLAVYRRAATYVDKILRGAKPADLPIEQPTKFELVINLKTAKALGLTIPPSLLSRADEIIQ